MRKQSICTMKHSRGWWSIQALLLIAIAIAVLVYAQTPPSHARKLPYAADPANLPIAISKVEKGDFTPLDVEVIARWHGVKAIPSLEKQFDRSNDRSTKAKIANALARLGVKDGPYWDYLADQARKILNDVPPTPIDYDANGTAVADHPSKKFSEWAKRHQLTDQQAWQYAMVDAVSAIFNIGSSDDKRGIPILRRALGSDNDFIRIAAAQGLAELHDSESIPAIIAACKNAPKEASSNIAEYLVYFDDPAAQRAVDTYVAKNMAKELRESRAHGKTPYR